MFAVLYGSEHWALYKIEYNTTTRQNRIWCRIARPRGTQMKSNVEILNEAREPKVLTRLWRKGEQSFMGVY